MLTTQTSAGLRHARDSPIAHARESFIDLYFGIIPFVQRSLQFLQLITVHINSPVLWNWPVNVDINLTWIKILARGICCQNENESVMNTVFTDPRRRRSGRVRRLRKNPIQCSFNVTWSIPGDMVQPGCELVQSGYEMMRPGCEMVPLPAK